MPNYRPVTDIWLLARPKVKFYGAYPSGFLSRARELLGVCPEGLVLHVCSGKVKDYPFKGFGVNDKTLDVDAELNPDYVVDIVKEPMPLPSPDLGFMDPPIRMWDAILVDPPYTLEDAKEYGDCPLPGATTLLKKCLGAVKPGHRVGMLHYIFPRPPKDTRLVACVGVLTGFGNRIRCFSVFERGG